MKRFFDWMKSNVKEYKISTIGLLLGILILISCEKSSDTDKGNVSFGVNTHVINCIVTDEVFIDNKTIGTIPGYCDSVVDCNSTNTLNKDISVGKHSYKIEINGQSGSCYSVKEGDFELSNGDCLKIFMNLTKQDD